MFLMVKAWYTLHRNRRRKSNRFFLPFLAPISGTCVLQISERSERIFQVYQIPSPIRTLFYSEGQNGVHVTVVQKSISEWMTDRLITLSDRTDKGVKNRSNQQR